MATIEKYFFDAKQANTTKLKPICKKAYFRKALKVVIDLQKRKKIREKTRTPEQKKRRRGGSAPLGVTTNDNNVITQTLLKIKINKDNRKHGRFNTIFFKLTALG